MSRLHVLASGQCVLHEPTPPGNNSAGVPWKDALVNSGMGGKTVMPTGTGAGQITATELAQIQSGALYEITFHVELKVGMSPAEQRAVMDAQISTLSRETLQQLQRDLRFFGLTR